jgi:hypothetical protein
MPMPMAQPVNAAASTLSTRRVTDGRFLALAMAYTFRLDTSCNMCKQKLSRAETIVNCWSFLKMYH